MNTTSIGSIVTSTDLLNDLRIAGIGTQTGSSGMVIDRATVSGSTSFATYTLYPVRYTDAADATADSFAWGLAGS